jgi:hypothetical protein
MGIKNIFKVKKCHKDPIKLCEVENKETNGIYKYQKLLFQEKGNVH